MAKIDISHEKHLHNSEKVEAFKTIFGEAAYTEIREALQKDEQIIIAGKPVTNKSQVKDPRLYAEYFQALREKGLKPLEIYSELPD